MSPGYSHGDLRERNCTDQYVDLVRGAAIDLNRRGEVIHDSSAESFRVNAKSGTAPNGQAGVSA
jgi:hypothetical protein